MKTNTVLLEMKKICKYFPGVKALENIDFSVNRSEVHALMGENGAGKSTLIKILTGIYTKDSGTITLDGEVINPVSALQAQQLGISTIYQELNLIPYLSIAENIYLGREPKRGFSIDWKKGYETAKRIMNDVGLDIDVTQPLYTQGTAIQQMVAIARVLNIQSKLVVMDEPTSCLDTKEVEILFNVIRKLKAKGISVIFITHRLDEIYEICDRATILKDGKFEGCYPVKGLSKVLLVSKMIGRDASKIMEVRKELSTNYSSEEEICQMNNIHDTFKLRGVSVSLRKGEVLGIAGLLGSGRTELAKVLFGVNKLEKGEILVKGEKTNITNPKKAIAQRFAFCPEDRRVEGIIPNMSVKENISLVLLPKLCKMGIVSRKKQDEIVNSFIERLRIKTPNSTQIVKNLSGGNQQKVVLARWLCTNPELIIMDEPTRGIDVGAKAEIEQLIKALAKEGISVLMISSEIAEIVRNCDRVTVMRDGKSIKDLLGEDICEDNIMKTIAIGHTSFLHDVSN